MGSARASSTRDRLTDGGLLFLRVGSGISLFLLFGLSKLHDAWNFHHTGQWGFVDFNRKLGLPAPILIACLQTLNESVVALFLAAGFLTRYAAASLTIGFAAAMLCSLKVREPSWLLAFYYVVIFATLLLTGAGRFSGDHFLQTRKQSGPGQ